MDSPEKRRIHPIGRVRSQNAADVWLQSFALQTSGWRKHCTVLQVTCDRYDSRDSHRFCGLLSQSPGHLIGGAGSAPAGGCAETEASPTGVEPTRRLFWIMLRNVWPRWSDALAIVKPATVITWHRAGFRLYWRWRSRRRIGRPRINQEIRILIRKMRVENPGWGAPKIHGELLKLGFNVSERTVARYLRRLRPRSGKRDQHWKAFLANHREVIVAFDFLHCTHVDVQAAVLLPSHRAWPAQDSALQRHRSSHVRMGCAAVAGNVSRSASIPVRHLRP